jgi:hypothetical protein
MAQRGRPLSGDLARAVVNVARSAGIRAAAKLLHVNRSTVQKYVRSAGEPPADQPTRPPAQAQGQGATS